MSQERGRRKLMLRLPDIRRLLARMVTEMLEAYDLAGDALDRFRKQSPKEENLIREYEQLCREIEQEVLIYCTSREALG